MRDIKFRGWDTTREEMFLVGAMTFNDEKYGIIVDDEEWNWRGEGVILMQFIGLKDKNGKEIFEGDVVKVYPDASNLYVADIKWSPARPQDTEIIGNIYENPELIK